MMIAIGRCVIQNVQRQLTIINVLMSRVRDTEGQEDARRRCDMRTLMVEASAWLKLERVVTFPANSIVRERAAHVVTLDLQTKLCSTSPTEEVSTAHVQPTMCAVLRFAVY
eukprot:scaffold28708_cov46-Attheya_sp.AAC.3